jgi:PRC-barrel domain
MALNTIDNYDTHPTNQAGDQANRYRIRGFDVNSDLTAGMLSSKTEERIGTVADALIDDAGQIQYVVVDMGANRSGRRVLLPADRTRIDYDHQRVYAAGMTKEQAEFLPEFDPSSINRTMS